MILFKHDMADKTDELNVLFSHINYLERSTGNIVEISILKSSYVLMMYNMVESMMTIILETIHEKVSNSSFDKLCDKLKVTTMEFYFQDGKPKNHLESLEGEKLSFPHFEEFNKKIRLFSGNLDARSINEIINKRYGIGKITVKKDKTESLLYIKNKRNKLAHGELMFKDACRDKTTSELDTLKNNLIIVLENIIKQVEYYLKNKRYLNSN